MTAIALPEISDTTIPMAFPCGRTKLPDSGTVLAADIGGTKMEFALFQIQKRKLVSLKMGRYPTEDHNSFMRDIRGFLMDKSSIVDCACLGVAGIIEDDKVKGVNFKWDIDAKKLESILNIKRILLINDLRANAFGLSALEEKDFEILITPKRKIEGNAAIVSAGTGLGEAGMFWDGSRYHPFATEGGHCNFGPQDDLDVALWKSLKAKFGHVSWERLISGKGIYNIYQFLREYRNIKEPARLTEKLITQDPPKVISQTAMENGDPICVETMELFVKYLSEEAAQLALKTKAVGGIYIGGGIVPKIIRLIDKEKFRKNFIKFGRLETLLETIPVKIDLNDKTALFGAAYYAAMGIYD